MEASSHSLAMVASDERRLTGGRLRTSRFGELGELPPLLSPGALEAMPGALGRGSNLWWTKGSY